MAKIASTHSHLMNMSEYFNLPDFNPDLLDIAMVKSYVSLMTGRREPGNEVGMYLILAKHPSTFSKT